MFYDSWIWKFSWCFSSTVQAMEIEWMIWNRNIKCGTSHFPWAVLGLLHHLTQAPLTKIYLFCGNFEINGWIKWSRDSNLCKQYTHLIAAFCQQLLRHSWISLTLNTGYICFYGICIWLFVSSLTFLSPFWCQVVFVNMIFSFCVFQRTPIVFIQAELCSWCKMSLMKQFPKVLHVISLTIFFLLFSRKLDPDCRSQNCQTSGFWLSQRGVINRDDDCWNWNL